MTSSSNPPEQLVPEADSPELPQASASQHVDPSGNRQVFRAIRRQLSDDDLSHQGVQKLILHMLEEAEADRNEAESFALKFHEADKQVAILTEKSKATTALDVAFGAGTGAGGAMIGAAFYFWGKNPPDNLAGWVIFIFGLLLFAGATAIKLITSK